MDVLLWKQKKKELKLTNQLISDMSSIPLRTVEAIFAGKTKFPRSDTVDAIEKVLGINNQDVLPSVPEEKKELVDLILKLNDDSIKELRTILDYVLKK